MGRLSISPIVISSSAARLLGARPDCESLDHAPDVLGLRPERRAAGAGGSAPSRPRAARGRRDGQALEREVGASSSSPVAVLKYGGRKIAMLDRQDLEA